jgi:hypothetical protein
LLGIFPEQAKAAMSPIGTKRQLLRRSGMSGVGADRKWLAPGQSAAMDPNRTFGLISSAKKARASRARAFAADSKLADSSAITGIIVGLQHRNLAIVNTCRCQLHRVKREITNDFRTITVFIRCCH